VAEFNASTTTDLNDLGRAYEMVYVKSTQGMARIEDLPMVKGARATLQDLTSKLGQSGEAGRKAARDLNTYRLTLLQMARSAKDPELARALQGIAKEAKLALGGGEPTGTGGNKERKDPFQVLMEDLDALLDTLDRLGDNAPQELLNTIATKFGVVQEAVNASAVSLKDLGKVAEYVNRAVKAGNAIGGARGRQVSGAASRVNTIETRAVDPLTRRADRVELERPTALPTTGGVADMVKAPELSFRQKAAGELFDMAGSAEAETRLEALDNQLKSIKEGSVAALGDAFTSVFESIITDAPLSGAAFAKAILGSIAAVSKAKGDYYLGESLAALGSGLMGNPGGFAAAGKYAAAAVSFYALAGIGGGAAANAGGGGSSFAERSRRSLNGLGAENSGEANIIVQGGFLDMTNPRQADQLSKALQQLTGRRVVITSR
jgi:hypothetical protein